MKILFSVNHPAQVHLFKNIIRKLQENNHSVVLLARDKDVTVGLLDRLGLDYKLVSKDGRSPISLLSETLSRIGKFTKIINQTKPDLTISQMDPSLAIASKLRGVPYICMQDSEPERLLTDLTLPFVCVVLTPSSFTRNLGKKQVKYNGYKELAYLHPNTFDPDLTVLSHLQLNDGESFIILRFVSWTAHHDVGQHGIQDKVTIVNDLERYGKVFISSEGPLEPSLENYRLSIPPEKLHDVLYYAKLLFCDSQSMTTEAAILGTPAVRSNSFVGKKDMGNFIELEKRYDLIFNCESEGTALSTAVRILNMPDAKGEWAKKREKLLKDKIDVTAFMVWFIENYPQSFIEMKERPEVQYSCAPVPGGAS